MFTQSCFIRKNSLELRKKLEYLGHVYDEDEVFENAPITACEEIFIWNAAEDAVLTGFIDCGTNEELFLALATLQDDTDEGQWFVYPESDYWFKCDVSDIEAERNDPSTKMSCQSAWFYKSHKAIPEELIKHFNHG